MCVFKLSVWWACDVCVFVCVFYSHEIVKLFSVVWIIIVLCINTRALCVHMCVYVCKHNYVCVLCVCGWIHVCMYVCVIVYIFLDVLCVCVCHYVCICVYNCVYLCTYVFVYCMWVQEAVHIFELIKLYKLLMRFRYNNQIHVPSPHTKYHTILTMSQCTHNTRLFLLFHTLSTCT